jgi:hypothetical protein
MDGLLPPHNPDIDSTLLRPHSAPKAAIVKLGALKKRIK